MAEVRFSASISPAGPGLMAAAATGGSLGRTNHSRGQRNAHLASNYTSKTVLFLLATLTSDDTVITIFPRVSDIYIRRDGEWIFYFTVVTPCNPHYLHGVIFNNRYAECQKCILKGTARIFHFRAVQSTLQCFYSSAKPISMLHAWHISPLLFQLMMWVKGWTSLKCPLASKRIQI